MIDRAALLGSWRLERAVVQIDGRDSEEPGFGAGPTGYIHYLPDGRMAALIAHGDQQPLGASPSDAQRLAQSNKFVAYGGTFSIDGDAVIHHVDIGSNASGNGTDYVRYASLDGDTLALRTPPEIPIGRPMSLVWRRVG